VRILKSELLAAARLRLSLGQRTMPTVRYEHESVDFNTVANPKGVWKLEIAFCDVASLSGIERLSQLREVQIHYCRSLRDLSHLGKVATLALVNLYCLPNVEVEFSPSTLPRLEHLSYNAVHKLSSIRGIEKLKRLTHLSLSRVKVLDGDYMPIVHCKRLQRVFWFGGPFKAPALSEIRRLRPDIVVGGNAYN
jgi:hypothetical protein